MRTIDTRGQNLYSPLIPAIKAMCEAGKGDETGNHYGRCNRL